MSASSLPCAGQAAVDDMCDASLLDGCTTKRHSWAALHTNNKVHYGIMQDRRNEIPCIRGERQRGRREGVLLSLAVTIAAAAVKSTAIAY